MGDEHRINRRTLFGAAASGAAIAGTGALAPAALANGWDDDGGRDGRVPRRRIGIQLYTMRRQIEELGVAPAAVFQALGRMGYAEVELAGHYDLPAREFRRQIERAGLRAFSGHDGPNFEFPDSWQEDYRQTLEYAAEVGQEYTGFAWFPEPYDNEDRYHFLAERFNEAGTIAREEFGLQFFYHNHDFEFLNRQASGAPMYDILLAETDSSLVLFQLDLFWITEGGANGIEYLSADPARFFSYHVKDHVWGDRIDEADFEDVGPGMLDFPDQFAAGHRRWLDKHYVIEHDWPLLSHPGVAGVPDPEAEFKTALAGVQYLRNVRF
jgi:sugar phosphate isomerase/epimerase